MTYQHTHNNPVVTSVPWGMITNIKEVLFVPSNIWQDCHETYNVQSARFGKNKIFIHFQHKLQRRIGLWKINSSVFMSIQGHFALKVGLKYRSLAVKELRMKHEGEPDSIIYSTLKWMALFSKSCITWQLRLKWWRISCSLFDCTCSLLTGGHNKIPSVKSRCT